MSYSRNSCFFLASVVALVTASLNAAPAARISPGSIAPRRPLVSAESKRAVPRPAINTAGCTPVTPSASLATDLLEPGPTATAAMVISASGTTHDLNVDATGCDIGIYVAAGAKNVTVEDVAVHDATRAGIVVDAAPSTTLYADTIYNIGDHPQSGDQYGFGVLTDSAKNVAVDYVTAYLYQKTGFNIRHSTGSVNFNTVTGEGPIGVPLAALNGFEFLNDRLTSIFGNRTELNQYTGPTYGGSGYLLFCTSVQKHVLTTSDQKRFAQLWQNLEAFDDISYYFDPTERCDGT